MSHAKCNYILWQKAPILMRLFHWLFPCVLKSVGLTICTKKFLGANMNAKLPNGTKSLPEHTQTNSSHFDTVIKLL